MTWGIIGFCLFAFFLLAGVAVAVFLIVRASTKARNRDHDGRRCYGCGARLRADSVSRLCERCQSRLSVPRETDARPESLVSVTPGAPKVADIRAGPPPLPDDLKAETPREGATTAPHVGVAAAPGVAELAGRFPHLEILEFLGQGGMGAVYKARQTKLDRLVALKVLPSESAHDQRFQDRFLREARALAKLSHPGIVAVHDFGELDGLVFFVMEYVDGANLRQVLRHGGLPPAHEALVIVSQVCDGLQYAHDEGIIHRDIKPENILIDKKGRVKIADFGLAKLLGPEGIDFSLTGTNQAMGTVSYMAPEQMESAAQVDHRADIYSLGVVLYEMLTGQLPRGRFPPPSEKTGVDGRLDAIVLRALESEPERRYQKVSEMQTEVEAITRQMLT